MPLPNLHRVRLGSTRLAAMTLTAAVASLAATAGAAAQSDAGPDGPAASPSRDGPRTKLVRLPLPRYDGTLTPYTFELGYPLVTLVYDTLLWRNAEGVPRPWLAQSVTRSDGGRRVTIQLRRDVRWQDGRPLTAADVAFTFNLYRRRFHPRFTPQLADVTGVGAPTTRTVTMDLRRPSLGFEDQPLADLPILPRHLWEGLPQGSVPRGRPMGSGPYRLTRANRRTGYSFVANRDYFRRRPAVDRVRVSIIRQEVRTYSALRRRRVDMLPVSLPEIPAKRLGSAFGISILRGPSYSGTALLLNVRRPPFDDLEARRAVARSLDLDRILKSVGPGASAERGYLHPDSPWAGRSRLHRFDEDAARKAFRELDLRTIRVLAPNNDSVRLEAAQQAVLALRRAGARATLAEVSRASLGRAIGEDGSGADFDAAIVTTPPLASNDPDFLQRVFGSGPDDAPLNYSGYRSQAFESLADRVAGARSRGARRRAVQEELALLARDLPAIPLFFSEGAFGYRPAIHDGWVFVKGAGILDKRSFLSGSASSPEPASQAEEDTEEGGSFLDVLRVASLVVLAIVLALGAVALLQRRKAGQR